MLNNTNISNLILLTDVFASVYLSYTQRHFHVRIEKGSVQTVAIQLEAHNSLEYHYILKCYMYVYTYIYTHTPHKTG